MLIHNKNISVTPITTHIDIKNVSKNIKIKKIVNKSKTIDKWFKDNLRIKPKIGILGLNPHNSEMKKRVRRKNYYYSCYFKIKKKRIKRKRTTCI